MSRRTRKFRPIKKIYGDDKMYGGDGNIYGGDGSDDEDTHTGKRMREELPPPPGLTLPPKPKPAFVPNLKAAAVEQPVTTTEYATGFSLKPPELIPIIDDYYELSVLGKGSFGSAVLCEKRSECNAKYVVKIINFSNDSNSNDSTLDYKYISIMNEIFILDMLRTKCEKYIMCYVKTFIQGPMVYIVCEYLKDYVPLNEIYNYIQPNDQNLIKHMSTLFNNMIEGMLLMHSLNICHRDIKPDNILFNTVTYDIKYIDFGLACLFIDDVPNPVIGKVVGTPFYLYPGIALNKPPKLTLRTLKRADYFSLGMTFFIILSKGKYPFELAGKDFRRKEDRTELYNFNDNLDVFFNTTDSKEALKVLTLDNLIMFSLRNRQKKYIPIRALLNAEKRI